MSSVSASTRQISPNNGYFIPIANAIGKVYAYNPTTGAASTFSTATWASASDHHCSSIAGVAAGLLKDMGKTVVSSGRTFRKVQLVVSSSAVLGSTFGVGGAPSSAGTLAEDYLTGYIELGFNGDSGAPAPFATFGR
jgi:hypothetical protein